MQREWRDAVATVPVLGLASCVLGSWVWTGAAKWLSAPLGTAALLFAVFTLVTGDGVTLALLVGLIAALWLVSTVRHLRTPAGQP